MKNKLHLLFTLLFLLSVFVAACGSKGPSYTDDQVANGEKLFMGTCSACHGTDGKGLPNLGKDLTNSAFVQEKTDEELLAYTLEGRAVDDPLNTTGIAMPPKGGNPALTDAQILDIIAYIRQYYAGK
jgi:disulfide bond formation protein DsbB